MISCRKMQEQDIPAVAQIEQAIFSMPWSKQAFAESLHNENTLYVVAEMDGALAGYCGIYISFEEGNISNVAVHPKVRRQHVADQMLTYLIELATKQRVTTIVLEVRETNVPAIALYEKMGFKEVGMRKNFYEKPTENALIMVWQKEPMS